MAFKIIIHAGKAHMDEMLASALLCVHRNELPTEIERIFSEEATERVKNGETGSDLYYLDCGLSFDQEKNLFDHHQSRDLGSAALLVFETFFPHLNDTELHDYIKLISLVDNNGPKCLNDFDLIDESRLYWGMGQKLILKAFEDDPMGVIALFVHGIKDNIAFEGQKNLAREWIGREENISLATIENCTVLEFKNRPPTELITPLRAVDKELIDKNKVDIVYSFDDRDETVRSLFRTHHGHEKLDFANSQPENLQFCHQSGFLLKFIPSSEEEWMKLIKESVNDQD